MRRAIQMLQSLHQLNGGRLEAQAVRDLSGSVPRDTIGKVFTVCKAQNFDKMQDLVDELLADGYPAAQLIVQMLEALLSDTENTLAISSMQKAQIAINIAEMDKSLVDGADEYLQLTNLLATCMRNMK